MHPPFLQSSTRRPAGKNRRRARPLLLPPRDFFFFFGPGPIHGVTKIKDGVPAVAADPLHKVRRAVGLTKPYKHHEELANRMVYGAGDGKPLSLEDAARSLGMRLKNARSIFRTSQFQAQLAEMIDQMRRGARPAAIGKAVELMHEAGDGKAADRSVQLKAAKLILTDPPVAATVNVGVQVNNQVDIRAGYVIRLRPDEPAPAPPVIEATPEPEPDRFALPPLPRWQHLPDD
jgi:hypothetical protein